MTSKQVVLRVPITELPMLVERKSKQMALNNKPEPLSLLIIDLSYQGYISSKIVTSLNNLKDFCPLCSSRRLHPQLKKLVVVGAQFSENETNKSSQQRLVDYQVGQHMTD